MTFCTRDSATDIWGERTPFDGQSQWPARVDSYLAEEPDHWVQSCCVLCTNGCGVDIGVKDGRIVGVRGREIDRVNRGRLGPKGMHSWVANNSADRLTRPLIRDGAKGSGKFREASWDEAMELIVSRCKDVIDQYTSGAIGIYNSGQLFIEDYYTLSVVTHAGLGTNHVDGNTRLCTATAAMALRETFGCDGQPANLTDFDQADCIVHCGHNIASTQTVSWMRILDRRHGPNPPKLIVIDPRRTYTAKEADVHLAPRVGTNVAVMNGLLNLVIQNGDIDTEFIEKHTVGFEELKNTVTRYTPERVEEITGIPADQLREAARIIGSAQRLLCTVLQGFYQGNEATGAACQVNNLVLIRGMIGKPGCGVIQSNGQPTAQNTRETGCNGEFPGFRNRQNTAQMEELARIWNVDLLKIPHWAPPTHAMQIFRLAEMGAIRFLWILATNPAVSLPELHRIRRILAQESLFVVVQDAFMTETAEFADVILPSAIWGEKTGTFTNFERTVHLSLKAVEPPGEARADMDILIDFSRRMGFKDKDGAPLIKWNTPEEAFEAWKICSKGRPCDYSGITYPKLAEGSGIQWPCNEQYPNGKERLYDDFHFPTSFSECEDFGHNFETGAHIQKEQYKANDPRGRAILKAVEYLGSFEEPDDAFPFRLTTGRVVHHFHTRTKTGRSRELREASPDAFVQINEQDAERLGIKEGDMVEVASRRATVSAPARIGDILPGHVFIPFHYGYWDEADSHGGPDGRARAANELTLTAWDPVSKQPSFKYAAVQVSKAGTASLHEGVTALAGKVKDRAQEYVDMAFGAAHKTRSHVPDYMGMVRAAFQQFSKACEEMAERHPNDADVRESTLRLARFTREAVEELQPFVEKYGAKDEDEPAQLWKALFRASRSGGFGLLRNLQALYLLAGELHITTATMANAAMELRDHKLLEFCLSKGELAKACQDWCHTAIEENASQAIVVPS